MEQESPESFEDAFARAERAVASLESGDLPLQECLKQYEEGFRALKRCYALLDEAQKKVELLTAPPPTGGSPPSGGGGTSGSSVAPKEPGWEPAAALEPLREALERIDREQPAPAESAGEE